jgi:hypothetical protein
MIRAVRPTDLVALRTFLRRADVAEVTTHTWPKVQPESGHLAVLDTIRQALGQQTSRRGLWVALDAGLIVGYAAARARSEGLVWDVEHLHTTGVAAGVDLLEQACVGAVGAGALRVFLEVPTDSGGADLARRAGFERYVGSTLYRLTPPFDSNDRIAFSARPRLRADDHALFQLYKAAVPAPVRAAEAMTYEEWSGLHHGSRKWSPALFGDRQQYVWEMGDGLVGWMAVIYGQKSQYLEWLVHPKYESLLDRLLAYALTQVSKKAAVYVAARDYQPALAGALQRTGFATAGEMEILVRQLAARVTEPKLIPAKVIGG